MLQENQWLQQVLSINEDTSYHSNLTTKAEPPDDNSALGDETLNVGGIAAFRLENGSLTFRFFVDSNSPYIDGIKAFGASKMMLHVPARGFQYPVRVTKISGDRTTLSGFVDTDIFGENDARLSGITIWLTGIPEKWHGTDNWIHYEAMSTEQVQAKENGTVVIPQAEGLSSRLLSGFTLKADGWTAKLSEMPISRRLDPDVTHVCNLTNESGTLTGAIGQDFLKENLSPFLDFVFGQNIRFRSITGYKDGWAWWVRTYPQSETQIKTLQGNWFLRPSYFPIELSPLFQNFYGLAPDVKKHWRKVISQYVTSEEIMGTLRKSSLAASVSFAALEGLTRSIISTYPCKDEWLKKDLSLKRGKNIKGAIEMVANQELGRHSKTFREASEQISTIRNATFHNDLTSDEDPINAYHRWNASQALVEILLLSMMGLKEIPNRTALGTFYVMGKDMYEDLRKEQLNFD